jgi:hypothetical protein
VEVFSGGCGYFAGGYVLVYITFDLKDQHNIRVCYTNAS